MEINMAVDFHQNAKLNVKCEVKGNISERYENRGKFNL